MPQLLTYFTDANGTAGVGKVMINGPNGYGDIYINNETGCFMNCSYGVEPPASYVPWTVEWDDAGPKWGPGKIVKLFKDHLFYVNSDPNGPPGGSLYNSATGTTTAIWNLHTGKRKATHQSLKWNYTANYDFDIGEGSPLLARIRHDVSEDCAWKAAGFIGATILAMCAVATAETGVGAIAAGGAIMLMAKEGHDFSGCK